MGLVLSPHMTSHRLLSERLPPYCLRILILAVLTLIFPIWHLARSYKAYQQGYEIIFTLFVVSALTLFTFFVILSLLLWVLRIELKPPQVAAILVYCTVPITFGLWMIYIFNYLTEQRLTFVEMLLFLQIPSDDNFLRIIPLAFFIIIFNAVLVFYYSLKSRLSGFPFLALMLTILLMLPFYSSFIFASILAEIIRPGTVQYILGLLQLPGSLVGLLRSSNLLQAIVI